MKQKDTCVFDTARKVDIHVPSGQYSQDGVVLEHEFPITLVLPNELAFHAGEFKRDYELGEDLWVVTFEPNSNVKHWLEQNVNENDYTWRERSFRAQVHFRYEHDAALFRLYYSCTPL